MSLRKALACWLMIACAALLLTPASSAQSIFADLSGTVTDSSGAVVPGAKVSVQNASTGVSRQTTASSTGYFVFTQLPTGTYTMTAEAAGFHKWTATGIVLQ